MLKLQNISKKLGDFNLKKINLSINDGEYFVLLGPTGTGKTVVLDIIAGKFSPDIGEIRFNNRLLNKEYPENRNIGFVYQDYALFPHLNVKENILFGLKAQGAPLTVMEEKLDEMTELLEIKALLSRYPQTLSGGEQQRVALARALVISPEVLLLDEPLSALDPNTKKRIQEDLKKIHAELGTTTLHVTHDFNEALALADRIAIMYQGEIVQIGSPQRVFQHPKSNFIAKFVDSKNIFEGEIISKKQLRKTNQNGFSELNKDSNQLIKISEDVTLIAIIEKDEVIKEGKVNLTIRPKDIIISHKPFSSSARNSYQGVLVAVEEKLSLVEIKVDIGIELIAYITYHSFEKMGLKKNEDVYLTFKASAVHIY